MIDFKLFGGFGLGQTDRWTNEWTLVVVESLSRLKTRGSNLMTLCKKYLVKNCPLKTLLKQGKKNDITQFIIKSYFWTCTKCPPLKFSFNLIQSPLKFLFNLVQFDLSMFIMNIQYRNYYSCNISNFICFCVWNVKLTCYPF